MQILFEGKKGDIRAESALNISSFVKFNIYAKGKDGGHILYNKYCHISFLFVLLPHTEHLSKLKIEAKQMARPLRIEYPGAYYHDA